MRHASAPDAASRRDLPQGRSPAGVARSPAPWSQVQAALHFHADAFSAIPNVVGMGMSYRRRRGTWTTEPCVTVYVRRKLPPEELYSAILPAALVTPDGGSVGVDVVEAGRIRRRLSCGARIGWRGLHSGQGWGTLGLVARSRVERRPVAITAMHVTGLKEFPPGEPVRFEAADLPGGEPVPLGHLLRGLMEGVDAAKISIDHPIEVAGFLPGVGALTEARTLEPSDLHAPVQLYGARSRYQPGFVTDLDVSYPHDGLYGAFQVKMRCGSGDSGAVCCDLSGRMLGLYVGSRTSDATTQVFCPITAVLEALDCEL
ncbi:MAG TPA: hypothetical protein VEQ60_18745 [Longimicrobium sp.]|nr:hypothetical protein [Longimicrobium sp.]